LRDFSAGARFAENQPVDEPALDQKWTYDLSCASCDQAALVAALQHGATEQATPDQAESFWSDRLGFIVTVPGDGSTMRVKDQLAAAY
jgi:hypothetical protein